MGALVYLPLSGSSPLTDFSGNGFNLTGNVNIEVQDYAGIRKGCIANKGVTTSDRIYTDLKPTISNKTISFWLQLNNIIGAISPYILFWSDCQIRFISGGTLRIYYYNVISASVEYFAIPASLIYNIMTSNLNKWYHLVITYDFVNDLIKVFFNNKLIYTYISTDNITHRIYPTQRIFLLGYSSANTGLKDSKLCEFIVDTDIWSPARVKNEYLKHKGILYG